MEFLFNLSYHPIHARTRKDIYVYSPIVLSLIINNLP